MFRLTKGLVLLSTALLTITACGSDSKSADSTSPPASAASTTTADTSVAAAADTSVADTAAVDTAAATAEAAVDSTAATDASTTSSDTASCGDYCVETADGTVSLAAEPSKIVSLATTHTETLFAIGAGDQVIAVDDQSNYPAEALAVQTALSGYTPNVEAIAGYSPDLVIVSDDSAGLVAQLEALDIPVWVGPAAVTLDDVYTEIEQLGVLTGHVAEAAALVGQMQTDVSSIIADLPDTEEALTYYHELDNTYYSATSDTFIGQIYSLAGLTNIADEADPGNPYPQLNAEYIITADPQLIFLADTKCCGETPETVAARDGWADITAVRNGAVIGMDDDIASRWGPRVVDYLRAVVEAVNAVVDRVPAG